MQARRLTRIVRFPAGIGAARGRGGLRVGRAPGLGRPSGERCHRWSRGLSPILIVAIVAGLVVPLSAGLQLARPLPAHAASSYSSIVLGDGPAAYWRLGESSGTTMTDSGPSGNNGTYSGGYTLGQSGPIQGDTDTAVLFNGSSGVVTNIELEEAGYYNNIHYAKPGDQPMKPRGDTPNYREKEQVDAVCRDHGLTGSERRKLQRELEERARSGERAQGYSGVEEVARELKLGDFGAPSEPSGGSPPTRPQ